MRVSRVQAEENRQTVIDVASRLFREHGFDGIGLKDLMKGAGLTQGAFYKQFQSKDDLAAQASRRALEGAFGKWSAAAAADAQDPLGAVVAFYLSMAHRADRTDGCPVVALGSDAARQGADVKASFEAGIRKYLEMVGSWVGEAEGEEPGGKAMAIISTMVGAVLLARAVNDERLSKRFLQAAAESVLNGSSSRATGQSSRSKAGSRTRKARPTRIARRHASS
jgi:TetR/AcrR family transcriptional repressor of nem operon